MKQFDRYLITYNQLDALRADGRGKGIFLEILYFLGVMVLATVFQLLFQIILSAVGLFVAGFNAAASGTNVTDPNAIISALPNWFYVVLGLFSTLGMILGTWLILRFAFKRKLSTAGFTKPFWSEYGMGLMVGFGMFAVAYLITVVTGTVKIEGLSPTFVLGPWLLIFAGFLIQGMSEEFLCRGYFMLSIARKNSVAAGVILNSLVFSALHLLNSGISVLAIVNLFLFGIFASLYYLWRGNIWGVAAVHSMWNFTQGNVFGILVSGGDFGTSLLTSTVSNSGTLLNGGAFGLEGGLAVTIVLAAGIVFVALANVKRIANTPMPLSEMKV